MVEDHALRIVHAVKGALTDQNVLVRIVKQNAAHLHAHQIGNARGDLAVKLFGVAQHTDSLRDLLEAAQFAGAALFLVVKPRIFHHCRRLPCIRDQQAHIGFAEAARVSPVDHQQQAHPPPAYDHRGQRQVVDGNGRANVVEAHRPNDRRVRIVGVPPGLMMPDVVKFGFRHDGQPIVAHQRIRHAVKGRQAAESLFVLVVKQHAAQLHVHQLRDALRQSGIKLVRVAELSHHLSDLLQAVQFGHARRLLGVNARHLQSRRHLAGDRLQQGHVPLRKGVALGVGQFQRADELVPHQQRHAHVALIVHLKGFGAHVRAPAHIIDQQRLPIHGDPAGVPFAHAVDGFALVVRRDQLPCGRAHRAIGNRVQRITFRVQQCDFGSVKAHGGFQRAHDDFDGVFQTGILPRHLADLGHDR